MKGNRNAAKGARYKAKTKKWLVAQGYQVADLEVIRWIYKFGGQRIPVKHDQFGSDLLAMKADALVFVQVKGGDRAHIGNFPAARRSFEQFVFPTFVDRWVVAWPTRARQPRVMEYGSNPNLNQVLPAWGVDTVSVLGPKGKL